MINIHVSLFRATETQSGPYLSLSFWYFAYWLSLLSFMKIKFPSSMSIVICNVLPGQIGSENGMAYSSCCKVPSAQLIPHPNLWLQNAVLRLKWVFYDTPILMSFFEWDGIFKVIVWIPSVKLKSECRVWKW